MSLKQEVVEILNESRLERIHIRFLGHELRGRDFRRVAGLVDDGFIAVHRSSGSRLGVYDYEQDKMYLRWASLDTHRRRAVAVHEAAHAIADLSRTPVYYVYDEAVGYLAELWYLSMRGADGDVRDDPVLENARPILASLRGQARATREQLEDFLAQILIRYPSAGEHSHQFRTANGISSYESWITNKPPQAVRLKLHDGGVIGVFRTRQQAESERDPEGPPSVWSKGQEYECWLRRRVPARRVKKGSYGVIGVFTDRPTADRYKRRAGVWSSRVYS